MRILCGVDLIETDRVADAYRRRPELFMRRFFSPAERAELKTRGIKARRLAARFAAKEAVFKLLGAGLGTIGFAEVEILTLPSGKPEVRLQGKARARAESMGVSEIAVSLSHSRKLAIAQAVALAEKK